MGLRTLAALLLVAGVITLPAACQDQVPGGPDEARRAEATGDYHRALAIYRRLATADSAGPGTRLDWARVLVTVGRYDEAERALEGLGDPAALTTLADLALLQGSLEDAERGYRAAPGLRARVRLSQLQDLRGLRDSAALGYRDAVEQYRRGGDRFGSAELTAVADALRGLGAGDPAWFREALRMYDRAIAADPANLEPRLAVGMLFLDKYNRPDALTTFDEILAVNPNHPEALLGKALVAAAEGRAGVAELLDRSLEINPNLTGARVARAVSLLEREDYREADAEARRALGVNPSSLEALTVLAASQWLTGDSAGFAETRRRVETITLRPSGFHAGLAEASARNRFYAEAVRFAALGVEADSNSAPALAALGQNQLRVGRRPEGRASLERAFALDPFNVWVKNTLDLLDTFDQYQTASSNRFRFFAVPGDLALLTPYLGDLAEEAWDRLAERYQYQPRPPVELEIYRYHADFSVRTVGLAGLGALGVSFGTVLAMDSPSARDRGEFNWGSTFWHELAHTFTLGVTNHRVPRWLSEGLSVLEERRARPGWGQGVRLGFLRAMAEERLLPVSRLNDGFVRPAYPEQVVDSYYQASLVCQMIEETWGIEGIRALLAGYRDGLGMAEAFETAFRTPLVRFDREFEAWMRKLFAGPLAAIAGEDGGPFGRDMTAAMARIGGGEPEAAIPALERAVHLVPTLADPEGPHLYLARIHRDAGRLQEAAAHYGRLTALAEGAWDGNLEEAAVRERIGDLAGAAAALERAIWIDPREAAVHEQLARLHGQLGDWRAAAREREALLALDPADRAEAYYQLADAWFRADELSRARSAVLQALDIAPAFERAQELLLRIRAGRP